MDTNKPKAIFGKFNRLQLATAVAILFHVIGLIGILWFNHDFFIRTTVFNLLLMFALLLYTEQKINSRWMLFFLLCFLGGIIAELIGVHTAKLFGEYRYGDVLGLKIRDVPLMIGINWFIVMLGSGRLVGSLSENFRTFREAPKWVRILALSIDAACIAVVFDWIMEPVAIKLGFWQWGNDGSIPFYNYVCWFLVSLLLQVFYQGLMGETRNKFALHLLMIQAMFFLILRSLL